MKNTDIIEKILNRNFSKYGLDGEIETNSKLHKAIAESMEEAINYAHSSLPLKDKEILPFVDWLNKYVKGTVNEYVYDGVTHSSLQIVGKYEQWLKENF